MQLLLLTLGISESAFVHWHDKLCGIIIHENSHTREGRSRLLSPIAEMVAFSETINCLDKNTVPTMAE